MSLITGVIGGIMGGHAAGTAANAQVGGAQQAGEHCHERGEPGERGHRERDRHGDVERYQRRTQRRRLGPHGGPARRRRRPGRDDRRRERSHGRSRDRRGKRQRCRDESERGLDPYASAGSMASSRLASGLAEGGDLSKTFDASQMEANDPGYQFRLEQGQQALERSAAAHGSVMGGGVMKALTDYARARRRAIPERVQSLHDEPTEQRPEPAKPLEFGSGSGDPARREQHRGGAVRRESQFERGADRGEFEHDGRDLCGELGIDAAKYSGDQGIQTNEFAGNLGVQSAQTQAANSNAAAQYAGNAQVYAGNARAAGILGKQSAYNGMLSGIGGAVDGAVTGFMAPGSAGGWTGALRGISGGDPNGAYHG